MKKKMKGKQSQNSHQVRQIDVFDCKVYWSLQVTASTTGGL